jgi:hypothetical protein
MNPTIYRLKTWPEFFQAVKDGRKNFEVRKNDRSFCVGDELLLEEFVPENYYNDQPEAYYTGQVCHRKIHYILNGGQFGVEEGYVVLALKPL